MLIALIPLEQQHPGVISIAEVPGGEYRLT